MLITIEGNIGSGKSTIIEMFKKFKSNNIVFVDEPVSEWQDIKVDNINALDLFYKDQKKNAFWFQILAYITRLRNLIKIKKNNPDKIIITERSIYTDKYIFAKMHFELGNISEIEWKTYNYWFDTFFEDTKLDLILYVDTNPDECLNRIKKRNRLEEDNIKLEYLIDCDKKHRDWIENSPDKVVRINGHQSIDNIKKFLIEFTEKLK